MILEEAVDRIKSLMAQFAREVEASIALNLTDINRLSEILMTPLLKEVYGYDELENLNFSESENFPSIDLGDKKARVAFQITSTSKLGKIRKTKDTFFKNNLDTDYDKLFIYILGDKQRSYSIQKVTKNNFSFDPKTDILDHNALLQVIKGLPIEKVLKTKDILEQYFRIENGQRINTLHQSTESTIPFVQPLNEFITQAEIFIGRENEFALVQQTLETQNVILVTGPAGIGKTTFSKEFVFRLMQQDQTASEKNNFADGAILIDGRNIPADETGKLLVIGEIAEKLSIDVRETKDWSSRWFKVQSNLAEKNVLIMLDNFEGEILYSDLVKLASNPSGNGHLTLIITAQISPSRKVAKNLALLTLPTLSSTEGQELFLKALEFQENELSREDTILLKDLISPHYLGELPLAIILAATNVELVIEDSKVTISHALIGLKASLDRNLLKPLKALPGANLADHHRSIQVALDISYDRLDQESKIVFESICLIPGTTFSLEALGAAAGIDDPSFAPVLQLLKKGSLLQVNQDGRYTFLPIIKIYGKYLLEEKDQNVVNSVKKRLIKFYQSYAEINKDSYGDSEKLRNIALEWNNFIGCLSWCKSQPNSDYLEAQYSILKGMAKYIEFSGRWLEGLNLYEEALQLQREAENLDKCRWILYEIGTAYFNLGSYDLSLKFYQESLDIANTIGDRSAAVNALQAMVGVSSREGNYSEINEKYEDILKIQQELGNIQGQATVFYEIGRIAIYTNNYSKAELELNKGMELYKKVNDQKGIGTCLLELARLFTRQEDYQKAIDHCNQAQIIFNELDFKQGQSGVYHQLGIIYSKQNILEKGLTFFQEAFSSSQISGDTYTQAISSFMIVQISLELGLDNKQELIELMKNSITIAEQLRLPETKSMKTILTVLELQRH